MDNQTNQRLAISIAKQCTDVTNVNQMNLCKLPLEKRAISSEISAIVNRYSFGKWNPLEYAECKTILLMGATGTGKTTWINAMINYVLGVEWDDPFRFVLIDEPIRGGSQAHSQTQDVNVYDIHHQKGFRVPFSLTIVDTPGFGDIARDEEIQTAIEKLFKDKNGIAELEAVCFAVKCSDARLTHSQKYIFNSVLSIFERNDITENIRFLATFADGRQPKVLEAIKEAQLPCQKDPKGLPFYQKFNNGAIYVNNQDDEEDEMSPIQWKNGMKNFKLFFDELSEMPTKSLQMTTEVLEDRKYFKIKVKRLQGAIAERLTLIEELHKKQVEMHKALSKQSSSQTKYQISNYESSTKQIKKEQFHLMCPNVEETQTLLDNMRENYESVKGTKMNAEELMEALRNESDFLKKDTVKSLSEIKDLLFNKLRINNALHGDYPLTTVEYIRMMIENEKKQSRDDSAKRIHTLEELLSVAKFASL